MCPLLGLDLIFIFLLFFHLFFMHHLFNRPHIIRCRFAESLEIEVFDKLRQRSFPWFLLMVIKTSEIFWVHTKLPCHLNIGHETICVFFWHQSTRDTFQESCLSLPWLVVFLLNKNYMLIIISTMKVVSEIFIRMILIKRPVFNTCSRTTCSFRGFNFFIANSAKSYIFIIYFFLH